MDQLIFAPLSHTHYWYEVGMLKVPAVCSIIWYYIYIYTPVYIIYFYFLLSHLFWTSDYIFRDKWTHLIQPGSRNVLIFPPPDWGMLRRSIIVDEKVV